jgi:hypothetical protein
VPTTTFAKSANRSACKTAIQKALNFASNMCWQVKEAATAAVQQAANVYALAMQANSAASSCYIASKKDGRCGSTAGH